ncbi:sensor histidine kinase [Persicobacter diffluens]|uniref:histidine kinase n=1 Tax=Persicobacter diffluens TaxID=981 RepID=A0AAN4VZG6_9BACT|nr:two-component sensor histidine kinase [Persicobacter diffluens]
MFYNSRGVASVLGVVIAVVTTLFLSLVKDVSEMALLVVLGISFSCSYILIMFTLEFLVFRELSKMYDMLDNLKSDNLSFFEEQNNTSTNPIKMANRKILDYASEKQKEIENLKRMEVYRREFLADVSHELKTPIFAAQGFVHTLLDGAMEDEVILKRFLKKAAKSLDGLDKMVHNLLSISQLESGDAKLLVEKYDLREQVEDIFDQLDNKAEKRNIDLKFSTSTKENVFVYADKRRIGHVMTNLVVNAIKYQDNDNGLVEVTLLEEDGKVFVSVADNGFGIPEEDVKRIFERFYRVEKSRAKSKGGNGLGLAIVRHILQAHGTQCHVQTEVGKGSTFSFVLHSKPFKEEELNIEMISA